MTIEPITPGASVTIIGNRIVLSPGEFIVVDDGVVVEVIDNTFVIGGEE